MVYDMYVFDGRVTRNILDGIINIDMYKRSYLRIGKLIVNQPNLIIIV